MEKKKQNKQKHKEKQRERETDTETERETERETARERRALVEEGMTLFPSCTRTHARTHTHRWSKAWRFVGTKV